MAARHALSPRPQRAYAYADHNQVRAIGYAVSLSGICINPSADSIWRALSPAGKKVFAWYAALNRAGKAGFRGTNCHYVVVAEQVDRASNYTCSLSTFKRGLKNCVEHGLLSRTAFALYDTDGRPVIKQIGPDQYVTVQISIVSLTDLGLSLFTNSRRVKMTPRQKDDSSSQPSVGKKLTMSICESEQDSDAFNAESTSNDVDRPTRPPGQALVTFEHRTVQKPAKAGTDTTRGVSRLATGVTVPLPARPASTAVRSADKTRVLILRALWYALRSYPSRSADIAYQRAVAEMSDKWPAYMPKCTQWGWSLNRWPDLDRLERSKLLRGKILPALRSTIPLNSGTADPRVEYERSEIARRNKNAFKRHQNTKLDSLCATVFVEIEPADPLSCGFTTPSSKYEHRCELLQRITDYTGQMKTETDPDKKYLFKRAIETLLDTLKK